MAETLASINPLIGSSASTLPKPSTAPVVGQYRGVTSAQADMAQEADRFSQAQMEFQTAKNSATRATQSLNQAKAELNALQSELQQAQVEQQASQQELAGAKTQAQQYQAQITQARTQAQAELSRMNSEIKSGLTQLSTPVSPTPTPTTPQPIAQPQTTPQPIAQPQTTPAPTQPQVEDPRLTKARADQALAREAVLAQGRRDKEDTARNAFSNSKTSSIATYGGNVGDLDKVLQQGNPAILPAAQALKAEFEKERIWLQSNKASSNGSPFRNNIMNLEKNLEAKIRNQQIIAGQKALSEWNSGLSAWRAANTLTPEEERQLILASRQP